MSYANYISNLDLMIQLLIFRENTQIEIKQTDT